MDGGRSLHSSKPRDPKISPGPEILEIPAKAANAASAARVARAARVASAAGAATGSCSIRSQMKAWRCAAVGVIAVVAIVQILYYFPRAIDDMFIYLRYAENAASGNGLVYNVGEQVEGFSSPAWLGLLTIGIWVGFNPITWSKLLAVGSLVALLFGQHRFARERLRIGQAGSWRGLLPLLLPALTACCSYAMCWGMLGLETPLYLALMVWSAVTFGRYVDRPSRRRLVISGAVCGAFALSRPESSLMLAAIGAGLVLARSDGTDLRTRAMRVVVGAIPAAASFLAYVVFRRAYFGLWLPETYYAKVPASWQARSLLQLVGDGASLPEVVVMCGGLLLAAVMAWRRRDGVVIALALATGVYISKAGVDWMPSVRLWVPLYLLVPGAWLVLADELAGRAGGPRARRRIAIAGLVAIALVLGGTMLHQLGTDMRYSIYGFRARGSKSWTSSKSAARLHNSWLSLTHEWTPEVSKLDRFNMGMLTQTYRLIESDARPLEDTWFIGHDIGLVGYVTPVKVWETPGLFTRDIRIHGNTGIQSQPVTPALLNAAINRPIAMTELFANEWTTPIARDPVLSQRFEPTGGWAYLRERGAARPSQQQILERYQAALDKFPSWLYLTDMYGGPLTAAFERRARVVAEPPPPPTTPPPR